VQGGGKRKREEGREREEGEERGGRL